MPGCGTMPGYIIALAGWSIIGAGCIMCFFFLSLLSLEELLPLFFLGTKTPFLSL